MSRLSIFNNIRLQGNLSLNLKREGFFNEKENFIKKTNLHPAQSNLKMANCTPLPG
jgi:hypothetical protein